jgi:PAS domain S-box-containing protein
MVPLDATLAHFSLEHLSIPMWIEDATGHTFYRNPAWYRYTGLIPGAALGDRWDDALHPDDRERSRERRALRVAARVADSADVRMRGADGVYRWFKLHIAPQFDEAGNLLGWLGSATDVDGALGGHDRALRAMLEAMPQLAWVARVDGYTEFWNRRIRDYTGLDAEGDAGALWDLVVHPDDIATATLPWFGHTPVDGTAEAELRLRRHDGKYRWFIVIATAVRGADGTIERWFGSATDIEERKRREIAMRFLADVGGLLSATNDLDGRLQRIAQRAAVDIASSCAIFSADGVTELRVLAHAHADPVHARRTSDLQRLYPIRATDPRSAVARTGHAMLFATLPAEALEATAHNAAHLGQLEALGIHSMLIVPLIASGRTLGVLQMTNSAGERSFDDADLRLAVVLAERVAAAIDTEAIYKRDRRASLSFQHAALPRSLPTVEGLELRAVYTSAERGAEVGGDWYDAFVLPHGMLALSIGDVAGRGVDAAVLMSIVRQAIRVAMLQGLDPARALRAADLALQSEGADRLVTAFVARLDPAARTMSYAMAGHPSPFVRALDGSVRLLPGDPAPPLGAAVDAMKPPTKRARLDPGDLLLLYTDGLIESTRDPVAGERDVIAALTDDAISHAADPATFVRDAVLRGDTVDDVALLSVRIGTERRWSFACADAMAAHGARSAFVNHLVTRAGAGSDIAAAELVFGELVGNVVRYAPGPLDVGLDWREAQPVLHLVDRGPGYELDTRAPADELAENGRGLFLCNALGTGLHVRRHAAGGAHSRVILPVNARP